MAAIGSFCLFLVVPWLVILSVPFLVLLAFFPSTFYIALKLLRTSYSRRATFFPLSRSPLSTEVASPSGDVNRNSVDPVEVGA